MPENPVPPQQQPPSTGEDKTVAIISYLYWIGFIIAIVMHGSKKTQLGAFHLRQTLGLFLTQFAVIILIIIPIIGWILIPVFELFMLVCWIMGIIAAASGQMKPMPLVGPLYQKWFANAFN